MKRSFLKDLGLTDELIDTILDENGKDLENAKSSAKEEVENLKKEITTRDGQLEELKKSSVSSEELKSQIEELQNKNKADALEYEKKIRSINIDAAVKEALTDAKARNLDVVKPLLANFLSTAEYNEGVVKGLDEEIKKLVEGENTSFLFNTVTSTPTPKLDGMTPIDGKDLGDNSFDKATATYEQLVEYQNAHPEINIFE